ncbi:MAG: GNAT family N-acetyltransferase [Bacteroidetes bacterium]|nr:GNAT family N-acetyltransferase [Bacteroidota bacterium]
MKNFKISTQKKLLDLSMIHTYLSKRSYWAQNIPLDVVQRSIKGSICFGVYENANQIGFARLITDQATFAYLADVFILESHRNLGLSKWLMKSIHEYPATKNIRRWLLTTKDAHGLYAQFGWQPLNEDMAGRIMFINNPEIYLKK